MFRAEELQKIVVGARVIDWTDLEKNAKVFFDINLLVSCDSSFYSKNYVEA